MAKLHTKRTRRGQQEENARTQPRPASFLLREPGHLQSPVWGTEPLKQTLLRRGTEGMSSVAWARCPRRGCNSSPKPEALGAAERSAAKDVRCGRERSAVFLEDVSNQETQGEGPSHLTSQFRPSLFTFRCCFTSPAPLQSLVQPKGLPHWTWTEPRSVSGCG